MQLAFISTTFILGIALAWSGGPLPSTALAHTTKAPILNSTPAYTSSWGVVSTHPGGDCGADCGGMCGDGVMQGPEECDLGVILNNTPGSGCDATCHKYSYCGDSIVNAGEECDVGKLNGVYNSGCSTNCKFCGYCGDGIVDDAAGEQCDLGWKINGTPGANCTSNCTICEVPPVTCNCTCCGEGTATGATVAECEANCKAKCNNKCQTCNPIPSLNFCDITTSCINTPKKDYCACRAGYRADGILPTDSKQFRLAFPGQEYRVFVAPGVVCNTLCNNPFPGPISCQEVPVQDVC